MSDACRMLNQLFGDPAAVCTCGGRPRGRLEIIGSTEHAARPVSPWSGLPTCRLARCILPACRELSTRGGNPMDEGTLQLAREGLTYHARWIHDRSGMVQVWVGDRGPFSTIADHRGLPAATLARHMVIEFLASIDYSGSDVSQNALCK